MTYWVMRYSRNRIRKATGCLEVEQQYAGPFASSTEAWAKAQELNDEHDRSLLRNDGPNEDGIMFSVLSDEEIAEARKLGIHIIGNRISS
jgi:hypothetical protein